MKLDQTNQRPIDAEYDEPVERVEFDFANIGGVSRRDFLHVLGAGLLIVVAQPALGQPATEPARGRRLRGAGGGRGEIAGGGPVPVAARLHIGKDGTITVMAGKVECGQGARAELTQAAAEELRVPASQVTLIMADTQLTPNDGITAGSRSTPATVPAIREAAATAREMLVALAAKRWNVSPKDLEVRNGVITGASGEQKVSYADLASDADAAKR